jgi:hypothetical protein
MFLVSPCCIIFTLAALVGHHDEVGCVSLPAGVIFTDSMLICVAFCHPCVLSGDCDIDFRLEASSAIAKANVTEPKHPQNQSQVL